MKNKKFIVLAISYGHEANACLMVGGEITAYAAEERFTKKKCQMGYPKHAINFCLKYAKLKPNDIDKIAIVSKNTYMEQSIVNRIDSFSIKDFLSEQYDYWYPKIYEGKKVDYLEVFKKKININQDFDFKKYLKIRKKIKSKHDYVKFFISLRTDTVAKHLKIKDRKKIIHVDHEKGHQYYALYASPKEFRKKTLILTNEGMGDRSNLTVSIVKDGHLKEVFSSTQNKMGTLYKFITLLLGMKPSQHEFKVMGLAPYASNYETKRAYDAAFKNLFKVRGYEILLNKKPKDFYFDFKNKLMHCRFDGIAGALQKITEETLVQWIKNCTTKSKINSVIISGGVAQNIKAAIPIINSKYIKKFYINPSSGDSTLSVGGCYYLSSLNNKKNIQNLNNIYLGPEYNKEFILKKIKSFTSKNKNFYVREIKNNNILVNLLSNGKVLGRFDGRMELGQRALGNRSIIADPRNQDIVRIINSKIKFRDFWMPFTPTILDKYQKKYLINKKNISCPFMTIAFETTNLFQKSAPATIHPADKTTRPQILQKIHNVKYYKLVEDFGKKTGVYCLLNTSLNLHGYPMVCSPDEAIFTLKNSQLDGLIINNYLILRK
tara:strand:+ start:668 stop:2479 length:1812 start_codon:yes stop_codon:yes gene_type:complete